MTNANRNDQDKSAQPSYPKEDMSNRGAERQPGAMHIPGGAHPRLPDETNDIVREDDLLQDDIADEVALEVDSALDEARARGELREMPGMAEIERKREPKSTPQDS